MSQPVRRPRRRKNNRKTLLVAIIPFLILLACILLFANLGGNTEGESSSRESSSSSSSISEDASGTESLDSSSSSSSTEESQEPSSESSSAPAGSPVDPTDWRLVIASAAHPLGDNYDVELATVIGNYQVDARILEPLNEMLAAAQEDGVSLAITSAYRTVQRQEELYAAQVQQWLGYGYSQEEAEKEAARWVALPGTSEHNTGLALDIVYPGYYEDYGDLNEGFEETAAFDWLINNCTDYGFVLRYPKDKQDITGITYEPWHYRYVGVENAKAMEAAGQCLEEYLGLA